MDIESFKKINNSLREKNVTLVAVSKTKSVEEILQLYQLGQRDFGENYVQELVEKYGQLPKDIRWHFIGHLQSNKVKTIAPFISLIHSVDSEKLLKEINKQGQKNNRVLNCLLQVYIAKEETKFGFDGEELETLLTTNLSVLNKNNFDNVFIQGLMGMASFSNDMEVVKEEFHRLKILFDNYAGMSIPHCQFSILSMGMSADYKVAIEEGSNMVRIGSLLFGKR